MVIGYGEKPYGPKIWLVILPFRGYAFTDTEVKEIGLYT